MWADLKMNHVSTVRTRGEIIIITLAVAVMAVLLWSFASIARGQVHKAELRDAVRKTQRVEITRCLQEAPGPLAMRNCVTEVQVQTAQALDRSYGVAKQPLDSDMIEQAPVSVTGALSMVSMRY